MTHGLYTTEYRTELLTQIPFSSPGPAASSPDLRPPGQPGTPAPAGRCLPRNPAGVPGPGGGGELPGHPPPAPAGPPEPPGGPATVRQQVQCAWAAGQRGGRPGG